MSSKLSVPLIPLFALYKFEPYVTMSFVLYHCDPDHAPLYSIPSTTNSHLAAVESSPKSDPIPSLTSLLLVCPIIHLYTLPPYLTMSSALYLVFSNQSPNQLSLLLYTAHFVGSCSNPFLLYH